MQLGSLKLFQAASLLLWAGVTASAQTASPAITTARPSVRIVQKIDNAVRGQLAGTYPTIVERAAVGARLQASKPLSHMLLLLSPTDDQAYALRTLMEQQQDKSSANYHKWLTPDSYGQQFGVAPADLATITAWLQDQGFTVNSVAKGKRVIAFSGTVGQVEAAFGTEMHQVTVNGETHFSNTTNVSVPQAFAGVVRGISSLNDFLPKSNVMNPHKGGVTSDIPAGNFITPTNSPLYTSTSSGSHYVTPGDAQTIFNGNPLLSSGIDGTGQNISVIGQTDITLSDVQQFRSMFGLKKNDPTFINIGEDPGINGDDIEAYLDVEWAGGLAPGANINFIVGGSDYETTGGILAAGLYAVDNNLGDIITLSYGGCETNNAATGTGTYNTLWEQAASQGQSVFVSSGDSSATGCSASSAATGTAYGVNALGSSAYNVAVGGSMFVDYGPNQFWTTGAVVPAPAGYNFATATSYVPEAPWNEGALTTTLLNPLSTAAVAGAGIAGGGGGISIFTPRPSWQVGSNIPATTDPTNCTQQVNGTCYAAAISGSITSGLRRLVPDISFIAAGGHDATTFCAEGGCYNTSTGYSVGLVGGTSVATPVMAGVQALINQKNGGRQGNPNFHYYPLANADYVAGNCKATNGTAGAPAVTLPAVTCNFHDIVNGGNNVPKSGTDTVGLGFLAAAGFDEASGLGSVNITNVANNWNTVNFAATTTSFTLSPLSTTHGTAQAFTASVVAGSGTPTGDISIIAVTTTPNTVQRYTLSTGAYSGNINGLPGGTYNVYVHYEGDGTYGPSDSAPQTVTIAKETSVTTPALYDFYVGSVQTQANGATITYGYIIDQIGKITATSGSGIPTGTATFAVTNTTTGATLPSLTATLDASGNVALVGGGTYTALYLGANYPVFPVGSYSITINYSGDNSFSASSGTETFTIAKQVPTGALTIASTYITSGASETLTYTVSRIGGTTIASIAALPSGTVTFKDTTTGVTLGTSPMNIIVGGTTNSTGMAATLTTTGITQSGANTISATYSGDNNYAPLATATTGTVTVGTYTATSTALTVAAGTYYVGTSTSLTATVTPAASATVRFYNGSVVLGTATANATTGIATLVTTALPAGSLNLTATFVGTTTYASSTGTLALTVQQNITTLLLGANKTSLLGQPLALDGRISRSPSIATPVIGLTGTVTFYDGGNAIGSATPVYLPGGYLYYTANFSTSTLTRGVHSITAVYSGDANYTGATSGAVPVTVIPDNVWIANSTGSVSGISASGAAVANPTSGGTGVAIDNAGDVWSLNTSGSSVAEFSNTGTTINSGYTGAGLTAPAALAIDGAGMVWIANGNSTVSVLTGAGVAVSGTSGYPTSTATPSSLVIDASGNVWITSAGDSSVTEVIGAAAPVTTPTTNAVANNSLAVKP